MEKQITPSVIRMLTRNEWEYRRLRVVPKSNKLSRQQGMTSTFARNFKYGPLDAEHYLRTNKEGQPLQGQIPQTYQRYDGQGGESLEIDGSNRLVIDSDLSGGPLIINASANYNWYGRVVHILFLQALANSATFIYPNGEIHTVGTEVTVNALVVPAGQSPIELICDFYALNDVLVTSTSTGTWPPVPPSDGAGVLNFEMLHTNTWSMDNVAPANIRWDPASVQSYNGTSVTYNGVNNTFLINEDSDYFISTSLCLRGFLDRCLRITLDFGSPNTAVLGETAVGLTCQSLTGTWGGRLLAGTVISVQSQASPLIAAPVPAGQMNGLNTQVGLTGSNFIQIIQANLGVP